MGNLLLHQEVFLASLVDLVLNSDIPAHSEAIHVSVTRSGATRFEFHLHFNLQPVLRLPTLLAGVTCHTW